MGEIKTLYDAGIVADDALVSLRLNISALTLALDSLDHEGFRQAQKVTPAIATNLVARLPLYMDIYMDTLSVILDNMWNTFGSLQEGTNKIFAACQREEKS